MSNFNFEPVVPEKHSKKDTATFFRGQPAGFDPIYFSSSPSNRFTPMDTSVKTMYFSTDSLTTILETIPILREPKLPTKIILPKSELINREIIEFSISADMSFVDLTSRGALTRHRLKLDSDELSSKDLTNANEFATEAHSKGYSGIKYETRQGGKNSYVGFCLLEKVFQNTVQEISRQTYWSYLKSQSDSSNYVSIIGVQLIDDTTSIDDAT